MTEKRIYLNLGLYLITYYNIKKTIVNRLQSQGDK